MMLRLGYQQDVKRKGLGAYEMFDTVLRPADCDIGELDEYSDYKEE